MAFGIEDIAVWVLRGFGVLWIGGSIFLLRHLETSRKIDDAIDTITALSIELGAQQPPAPPDRMRETWLKAGAFLTLLSGVAMVFASQWAVLLLAALIVQQLGYFGRQRGKELQAPNAEEAQDERPDKSTVNGFYTCLFMAVLASWLFWAGRLN